MTLLTENRSRSRSYQFDFTTPYAVEWGETEASYDAHKDAYDLQDKHIPDALNQKLPPLYADAIDLAIAIHCADRLSLRGTKKHGWGRDLRLRVPVRCLSVWQSAEVRDALFETLQFLTQDDWQIDFAQKTGLYAEALGVAVSTLQGHRIKRLKYVSTAAGWTPLRDLQPGS